MPLHGWDILQAEFDRHHVEGWVPKVVGVVCSLTLKRLRQKAEPINIRSGETISWGLFAFLSIFEHSYLLCRQSYIFTIPGIGLQKFSYYCLFLALSFIFLSFNASRLLACICCAYRIQYDGMTLHCLLSLLRYNAESLCRSFCDHRACISLGCRSSTDTGCAGCRRVEGFNVKNTH